ncbi:MAG: type I-U CRISPR-associated helicase/endonuclease Cas3 [Archangium sp.]|nr:type I-U CRISPR-associated helicase/endonuclease Cas3 [Archangium sp.]
MNGAMMAFHANFESLTGKAPLPWQAALFEQFADGRIPPLCDLPTGLGKTLVIAIWLLALAKRPSLPRRLIYVVNRRTVVDQSTAEAERLRKNLRENPELAHVRAALAKLSATSGDELAISTLRGQFADNAEWRHDPSRPAIVVGTVDMIGSRLLFSGYGCGFKSRALHAAFIGQDALVVHDESHLEPAFQSLLERVVAAQERAGEARALKVMALSATARSTGPAFTLSAEDARHELVRERINAKKGVRLHEVADAKTIPEVAVRLAQEKAGAVLVFLRTVEHVEKCVVALKKAKREVLALTGTLRGQERDGIPNHPFFQRFTPGATASTDPVFLVCTSAGEVGVDISADHLVCDLATFDSMAQRFGRVNRYGLGDAEIEVIVDPIEVVERSASSEDEEDDGGGSTREQYDLARANTRRLLEQLPKRNDERREASPAALRELPAADRAAAFSPVPEERYVDEIVFDRWAFTTLRTLAGRAPVADWLHGVAEWEAPRTTVAWRSEVEWLREDGVSDSLDDFLADYPLRNRECLSDRSDRVVRHLEALVSRRANDDRVWLVASDGAVSDRSLTELLREHDRRGTLNHATVILPVVAGALRDGFLDGEAEFDADKDDRRQWDLGPRTDERLVVEGDEAPAGMRLVRSVARPADEGEEDRRWRLYVRPANADDDGSRNAPRKIALLEHLLDTEGWARRIVQALNLSGMEASAVVRAARWHDLGKNRAVWQRSIRNTEFPNVVLAKSGHNRPPIDLGHYRHELGSLRDAVAEQAFDALAADERELLLHLIAAHHGRARPAFPLEESVDPEAADAVVQQICRDVPLRFNRLQQRYGRWGLAWLESIVRVADYLASSNEEVPS